MSTDPPSPSKVAKGDGPFAATLYCDVHHIMCDNWMLHDLKPPQDASYTKTNILACPQEAQYKEGFYIFSTKEFTPSSDAGTMKSRREKFYNHMKLCGKIGDEHGGANYYFSSLRKWGPIHEDTNFQPKRCFMKCSCSDVVRNKPKPQNSTTDKASFKLASTNNTRKLHGCHKGNKDAPRKSCKYSLFNPSSTMKRRSLIPVGLG